MGSGSCKIGLGKSLEGVSEQAGRLKNLGKPEVVNEFLESSFTPAVERFAPGSELSAYASMIKGIAASFPLRPDLAQKFWETAAINVATGLSDSQLIGEERAKR